MAQTKRLVIEAQPATTVTVDLVGKEYVIDAPKTTSGLIVAERMQEAKDDPQLLMVELRNWVDATFGEKQGAKVWARLFDPKDQLDIPHISELIQQLTEAGTNPIT